MHFVNKLVPKMNFLIPFCVILLSVVLIRSDELPQFADCPDIQTRASWQARSPRENNTLKFPVDLVIIAHTVTKSCDTLSSCSKLINNIQRFHMQDRWWSDIGYNFLIGDSGDIFEGVGVDRVGIHTKGYNTRSLGIAFIGDYTTSQPKQKQLTSLSNLLACLRGLNVLTSDYKLISHSQVRPTESPGNYLRDAIKTLPHWTEDI